MAETSDFGLVTDYVLTLTDGTGSPKSYVIQVEPGVGSIKPQDAARGETQMMATDGSYTGVPRDTVQTRHAEIQVSKARIKDRGANTSEAVLYDVLRGIGYVAASWTSTTTPSDRKTFIVTLAAVARSGGVAAVTRTISPGWVVAESLDHELTPEGEFISFTIRGNTMTTTRA